MSLAAELWNRIQSAWYGFTTGYANEALTPVRNVDWDTYAYRLFRYRHNEAYYHNIVYTDLVSYATLHKSTEGLYKYTKPIYNPVARIVDLYVSNVFGGLLGFEDPTMGAIPIMSDDPAILEAIPKLWMDSNWQAHKSLLVREGSMKGDVAIKVVEDRAMGRVRMEVLPANQISEIEFDSIGNVTHAVITQVRKDYNTDYEYLYSEEITPDEFITYRDGEEFAFYETTLGEKVSRWSNDYGFVPLVWQMHKDIGKKSGATPFHNVLTKIDHVNDLASALHDHIRKTVDPPWLMTGINGPNQLVIDRDRDGLMLLYGPENSNAQEMVTQLDTMSNLEAIKSVLEELENDLPELSLSKVRQLGTPPSGSAINLMYQDATRRIEEARGAYAQGLTKAQAMALFIGAANSYEGYTQLSGRSMEDLRHQIRPTPVFSDTLSKKERLDALLQADLPPRLILELLDYTTEDIQTIVQEQNERISSQVAQFVSGTMGGVRAAA